MGWVNREARRMHGEDKTLPLLCNDPDYRKGLSQRQAGCNPPPWPSTRDDRVNAQGWHDRDKELRRK